MTFHVKCQNILKSFLSEALTTHFFFSSQQPENILLQAKNSTKVKLIDFGLSCKILPKDDHRAMMGTAEFIGKYHVLPW